MFFDYGRAEFRYTPNEPFFLASDVHAPGGDTFQWPLLLQSFPKAWDMTKGVGAGVAVATGSVASYFTV